MPGRQAHGRSLISAPKAKAPMKKSKARSQKNALNAFGIAQEHFPAREKKTPRMRGLDAEIERKHGRDDEEDDEEEEEEAPKRKRAKAVSHSADDDAEYGSDSEGNEWRLGGLAEDDEDSEIESDDAFGDSDDEKFQGYAFKGSKTSKTHDDDSEDDSQDDEGETLGADAIDLATALDQYEETSEEEEEGASEDSESGDEEDSEEASDESESDEDSDDEEADPEKLEALKGLIAGTGKDDDEAQNTTKQKIGLGDLGLAGLNDPLIKKSVKLMSKEQKETRPGATKKLAVPLPRRQQGRLDRSAAYEKTNETLERWTDTVKQNRRAEHLMFPLAQNSVSAGLDMTEIQPLNPKTATNELESTIMSIMEQSGLSMDKPAKPKEVVYDEDGNELSRKEIQNMKRREREVNSREAKRAARIKKIKSKSYHRVHRRARERAENAEREAMLESGELDSEEEREIQDRRRALERMGQRHKESKWAKMGNKMKRAVWDENFRAGLTEMARKNEELRRRKEGKGTGSGDDSGSDSGSEDDDAAILRKLDELDELEDDEPESKLMALKFMRKAEEARKKANDETIRDIRRTLEGGDEEEGSDDEGHEVGRRAYGAPGKPAPPVDEDSDEDMAGRSSNKKETTQAATAHSDETSTSTKRPRAKAPLSMPSADLSGTSVAQTGTGGAWTTAEPKRKKKSAPQSTRADEIDVSASALLYDPASKSKKNKSTATATAAAARDDSGSDSDSDADAEQHLPLAIRDQQLVARAFAGEDVVGDFRREKEAAAEADDDKVIDNTLPGWGSWVGEGVSSREKKRHQGRFLTKVEGIKKKDRRDAKLDKVMINEKRSKKNDRYLASQLPHPFESREQYERSLRLPVGPEWMTKETFQESTKPRVIIKQGIIAPMSKPMV
ncbi:Utp14 protein-domain-containing protein [Stachybotrys elegans]|uniref:Utp14 protein-domain-containing protein n=1 Tax=Stachybotrys elegans TaxID=80388 RepID=A0A8K0SQP3_9HYPO|nr:Utp14 protein-domain-containing protein [Stachybotrys elegans]